MGRGAIFLGLGRGGHCFVVRVWEEGGKYFSLGWRRSYFLEPRVSINAVTPGQMIKGYDEVSIKTAPLS